MSIPLVRSQKSYYQVKFNGSRYTVAPRCTQTKTKGNGIARGFSLQTYNQSKKLPVQLQYMKRDNKEFVVAVEYSMHDTIHLLILIASMGNVKKCRICTPFILHFVSRRCFIYIDEAVSEQNSKVNAAGHKISVISLEQPNQE